MFRGWAQGFEFMARSLGLMKFWYRVTRPHPSTLHPMLSHPFRRDLHRAGCTFPECVAGVAGETRHQTRAGTRGGRAVAMRR